MLKCTLVVLYSALIYVQAKPHPHVPCSKLADVDFASFVDYLDGKAYDQKFEVLMHCTYKRLNLFSENGKINMTDMKNALRRFHGDYYDDAVEFCRAVKQTENRRKNAVKVAKCIHEYAKEQP